MADTSGTFSPYSYPQGISTDPSFHMSQPAPTYGNLPLIQPATVPFLNGRPQIPQPMPSNQLPPTTVLATKQKDCQEDCAEEACLDESKFGAEDKGPSEDYTFFGYDLKPILPVALAVSTVIGAICMLLVQIPMLSRLTSLSEAGMSAGFGVLYGVTLGCMTYCAFADPGQVRKSRSARNGNGAEAEEALPKRAHKSWQYPRAIRRYDHYCKWLQNVIGLLNHREFVLMLLGLFAIAVLGMAVDVWLAVLIGRKGFMDTEIIVLFHLAYSIVLLAIAGPICRIHVGLVSRNETAQEWKNNGSYVALNKRGEKTPVMELDDDEYNDLFDADAFMYDSSRNQWDKGCFSNCFVFWCNSRWPSGEKGEW